MANNENQGGGLQNEKLGGRHIENQQLSLYYRIGAGTVPAEGEFDEASQAIQDLAYNLVEDNVSKLPNWESRHSFSNGELTEDIHNSYMHPRAELCVNEGEKRVIDGQLAQCLVFSAPGAFPLDLAKSLKEFCLQQFQAAAGDIPVTFVKARVYTQYTEIGTADWPEV